MKVQGIVDTIDGWNIVVINCYEIFLIVFLRNLLLFWVFFYYLQVCLRRTLLMSVREQLVAAMRWKSTTSISQKRPHVFWTQAI